MNEHNEDYQQGADAVIALTLLSIGNFPNASQGKTAAIKRTLWRLLDDNFDVDDYDCDEASRAVIDGLMEALDAFGFTEAQKSMIEHSIESEIDFNFGDGVGNR